MPAQRTPLALRLAAVPLVVTALLAGLWLVGGRIAGGYYATIALSAAWFVVASSLLGRVSKRRPELRPFLRGAFLATVAAVAIWFYLTSVRETEVHERVVTGVAPSVAAAQDAERQNVVVLSGAVESLAHSGHGRARVVELARGGRVLTLTDFDIDPGPQVVVRLYAGGDHVELGDLKGSKGDQQYRIPADVDLARYDTVVFWCVPFSQRLAQARLRPA